MAQKRKKSRKTLLRIEAPNGYKVEVGVEDVLELLLGGKVPEHTTEVGRDGIPVIDIRKKKKKKKNGEEEEDEYYDELRHLGK